jgi:hypothetical protein
MLRSLVRATAIRTTPSPALVVAPTFTTPSLCMRSMSGTATPAAATTTAAAPSPSFPVSDEQLSTLVRKVYGQLPKVPFVVGLLLLRD